jgi:hypothetical protein
MAEKMRGFLSNTAPLQLSLKPGMPAPFAPGPTWPPSQYDHLPVPGGSTVGKTDTDTLRRLFDRMGIADAHIRGRQTLLEEGYVPLLKKVHDEAGEKAVESFLQQYKD